LNFRFDEETIWLTLDQMASLFDRDKSTISRHIKNVYDEGELVPEATVAKYATVQTEGTRRVERQIDYYNLDVIISVGYWVKSLRGTQFRQWATKRLNEYIRKGFTLDDERLSKVVAVTFANFYSEFEIFVQVNVTYTKIPLQKPKKATTFNLTIQDFSM